jgi:hypothetical protein
VTRTLHSYYRSYDQPFREALRLRDITTWRNLWYPYTRCPECLQQAGEPCLDLAPRATALYLADPHEGRPSAAPEQP